MAREDDVAFVDHHAHFLTAASGYAWPPGDSWFPQLYARGSNPMDEPWPNGSNGDDLAARLRRTLDDVSSLGIVSFTEAGLPDLRIYDTLRALRDSAPLTVRVQLLLASGLAESIGPRRAQSLRTNDADLDVVGVKFYADGWASLHSCAVTDAFRSVADDGGLLFLDRNALVRRITPFADVGLRIATHAIGDRALDEVLDAYEHVYGDDCRSASPRIEHLTVTRPDQHERMAAMGVVACIQPSFARMDGNMATGLHDWTGMLDAGVRVVTGSDAPIGDASPRRGLEDLMHTHPEIGFGRSLSLMSTAQPW
jgi:predicted amidohydrolase YtcJ